MAAVAVSAGSIAFGSGSDVRYRSCHLCHNRERIDSMTVWYVPVTWRRAVTTGFATRAGHRHSWSQYSENTIGPLWGRSRACRAQVYADGSMAPDGLR
jgi:hypothetical protein